jgi:hypothetical protein
VGKPRKPGEEQAVWRVFDIDGRTGRVTSIDELIADRTPQTAHDPDTYVCPEKLMIPRPRADRRARGGGAQSWRSPKYIGQLHSSEDAASACRHDDGPVSAGHRVPAVTIRDSCPTRGATVDQHRFDTLTRAASGAPSRRAVVRGLLGAGFGLGTLRLSDAAAAKRKKKRKKQKKPTCDVCGSGCRFKSVQAAVDAAALGATIRLCPGTYREHVEVTKNLTLRGAGADRTFLDGGDTASPTAVLYVSDGAVVRVRDLTVRGGNSATGGGIDNEDGELTLERVRVTGNAGDEGAGIFTHPGATLRLIDSRVSGNDASGGGGGLWVEGGTVSLTRSQVTGNTAASSGAGLHINDGTVTLDGSQVTGNEATGATSQGGGFYVNIGAVTLTGTPVTGNTAAAGGGIYRSGNATVTVAPGSVTGNTPNNCAGNAVANCVN